MCKRQGPNMTIRVLTKIAALVFQLDEDLLRANLRRRPRGGSARAAGHYTALTYVGSLAMIPLILFLLVLGLVGARISWASWAVWVIVSVFIPLGYVWTRSLFEPPIDLLRQDRSNLHWWITLTLMSAYVVYRIGHLLWQ